MAFQRMAFTGELGPRSAAALRRAVAFAAEEGASLEIVDAVEQLPAWRRTLAPDAMARAQALMVEERERKWRRLAARVGNVPVSVSVGRHFEEVTRTLQRRRCDLLVIHVSGELDNQAMRLMRVCPTPTLLLRPSGAKATGILAAVDPDPADQRRDSLNDAILSRASELARTRKLALHVVHAWDLPEESVLRQSTFIGLPVSEVDAMVRDIAVQRRRHVDALVARHPARGLVRKVWVERGRPELVVQRAVKSHRIGLVVMGTVARSGLSGLVLGNTAETVVRTVKCSVLALKPPGFTSPVRPSRR
ncbi:MAG: universal stress protein [Polyangiaceae bacterium]|nr:universal stress protein [Polyangiaceae bacterium]